MGLGLALMEQTYFDERSGRIMNPNLADYHVAVHMDVPEIDVIWTDIPDPHTPMGAHGIGEIGITGVGAVVANAVYMPRASKNPRPAHHFGQTHDVASPPGQHADGRVQKVRVRFYPEERGGIFIR
jgi:hypothetical protein